jgi:hypothetical protein
MLHFIVKNFLGLKIFEIMEPESLLSCAGETTAGRYHNLNIQSISIITS